MKNEKWTAENVPDQKGKIIVITGSSSAHRMGDINLDDPNWEKRGYFPWRAYSDSKLANLYFTFELDRR